MLSSMIVKGVQDRAQRVIVYGPEGVGKSTLAAGLPAPIFLDTEDGTSHLDVPRVVCQSMGDVLDAVCALLKEEHGYRSVVIDTIDWCESMMVAAVVAEANNPKIKNIEDFGYGKGYTVLAKYAQDFLGVLNSLVARGLHVVLLAHSRRVKVELPDSVGSYDKYELKLTKQVAPLVKELLAWLADVAAFVSLVLAVVADWVALLAELLALLALLSADVAELAACCADVLAVAAVAAELLAASALAVACCAELLAEDAAAWAAVLASQRRRSVSVALLGRLMRSVRSACVGSSFSWGWRFLSTEM